MKKNGLPAKLALFTAALIWGSSFIVMKNTVDIFPPYMLLAIRFTIGTLALGVIFAGKLKLINKEYLKSGAIIGTCLFLAYGTQTIGLSGTSAGKNAFLTAVYCVIVPFLFWITNKKRPGVYNFVAAALCIAGIGFVSLTEKFSIGFGDAFTLIGGFFYAVHMVAIVRCTGEKDPVLITILQFAAAMVLSWIVGLSFEKMPTNVPTASIVGLAYLGLFPTALCMLLQNVGQKYTSPAPAAIILSLESVFGVAFSVALGAEQLTFKMIVGFVLIFCAVIISETHLDFLKKKKRSNT